MARCPNYNQQAADKYVMALRAGTPPQEAAAFAGVNEATIRVWRRRRPQFAQTVDKALADVSVAHMNRVRAAAAGTGDKEPNWRASLMLARQITAGQELARLRELTTDAV